jgi:23S rRNA pseudouridine2605 synthase
MESPEMSSDNVEDSRDPIGPLTKLRTPSPRAKVPSVGASWRLNRFLARAGFGSRRSVEELILKGSVAINGSFCRDLAKKVSSDDDVRVNGKQVHQASLRYLLLHKPAGYVCTRSDRFAEKTIFDLLPLEASTLFHVGRLDKDSEGLLLVTNDGTLSQQLLHPSRGIDKEYEVIVDHPFTDKAAAALKKGTWIEGAVARVESVTQIGPCKIKLVLHQGIKRQIRVMLGQLGFKVKHLLRTRIGPLKLRHLGTGKHREVTPEELEALIKATTTARVVPLKKKSLRSRVQRTGKSPFIQKSFSSPAGKTAVEKTGRRPFRTSKPFKKEPLAPSGRPTQRKRTTRSTGSRRPSR